MQGKKVCGEQTWVLIARLDNTGGEEGNEMRSLDREKLVIFWPIDSAAEGASARHIFPIRKYSVYADYQIPKRKAGLQQVGIISWVFSSKQ